MTGPATERAPRVGTTLGPVTRVPTREQLIRYAGAANDFAPIHFDDEAAHGRGFDGVIVHGLLKAAFLGEVLESWCGPLGGWVQRFAAEYRGVDYPGDPLSCEATVTAAGRSGEQRVVDFDLRITNARGQVTTSGTATVAFAAPGEDPHD